MKNGSDANVGFLQILCLCIYIAILDIGSVVWVKLIVRHGEGNGTNTVHKL